MMNLIVKLTSCFDTQTITLMLLNEIQSQLYYASVIFVDFSLIIVYMGFSCMFRNFVTFKDCLKLP